MDDKKPKNVVVSAFEGASQQLETASNLFIDAEDLVSAHVLACSSAEVLNRLLRFGGIVSIFEELKQNPNILGPHPFGAFDKFHDAHNAISNFFKHGGQLLDSTAQNEGKVLLPSIEFNEETTMFILLEAACAYTQLSNANLRIPSGIPYTPGIFALCFYCAGTFPDVAFLTEFKDSFVKAMPAFEGLFTALHDESKSDDYNLRRTHMKTFRDAVRTARDEYCRKNPPHHPAGTCPDVSTGAETL